MDQGARTADQSWLSLVERGSRPLYLAIAEAIREGVRSGRLPRGARLPPQRDVAARLGVDLSTVTRAYAEAQRGGLVTSRVGRGTFIASTSAEPPPAGGPVDMSMNVPPRFGDEALARRMWSAAARLEGEEGLALLFRYQPAAGAERDRAAGAAWLGSRLPAVSGEAVLVAAGAQAALTAVIASLARPGEAICAEALAFPGLRSAAAHLGVAVVGLAMDAEGVVPSAFAQACREVGPKALCCTPTLQNPTTATMSLARREQIVAVARRYRVPILEDDPYGRLLEAGPPPIAALAPDLTFHVAGLAKTLSPALRIAYVAPPTPEQGARVASVLAATTGMASPLTAALATRWIEDGTADRVLAAVRAETRTRRALAAAILGDSAAEPADAFHLWLPLPERWTRAAFLAELRNHDVTAVPADAFATTSDIPEAVRIGLGAPASREDAARALTAIRRVLDLPSNWASAFV